VRFVQRPNELSLVVFGEPSDEGPRGDHLEAHDLQRVQHQPRGKAELGPLGFVVVSLGLILLNKNNNFCNFFLGSKKFTFGIIFLAFLLKLTLLNEIILHQAISDYKN
jgi:hypothetical protein